MRLVERRAEHGAEQPARADVLVELRPLTALQAGRLLSGRRRLGERWASGYPSEDDLAAARHLLRELRRGRELGPFGAYEILEADSATVVGGVGFHAPPDAAGVVEIGYGVVAAAANRGYATEAVRIVMALAADLGARRVVGRVLPANGASRRVMEKAGMILDGLNEGYLRYGADLHDGDGRSR